MTVTVTLDGRCGSCDLSTSSAWSYCPYCGAHWTVIEGTTYRETPRELRTPPRGEAVQATTSAETF